MFVATIPGGTEKGSVGRSLALQKSRLRPIKKALTGSGLSKRIVSIEMGYLPAAEPFCIQDGPMARIVVTHTGQCFGEALFRGRVESVQAVNMQ